MLVKLRGKPTDVVLLQIYMPTSEAEEELVDAMYEKKLRSTKEDRSVQ